MSDQTHNRGRTSPGVTSTGSGVPAEDRPVTPAPEDDEQRLSQAQREWAEESEEGETTPAGAYPIGKAMTGGLINDELPDGGTDDITG